MLKIRADEECQIWILKREFVTIENLAEWSVFDMVADVLEQRRRNENPEAFADALLLHDQQDLGSTPTTNKESDKKFDVKSDTRTPRISSSILLR